MKLTRKLKINDLIPVEFNDFEKKLIAFLEGIIDGFDIYNSDDSGIEDRTFFMDIGGYNILDYSHKENHLYVKDSWIWQKAKDIMENDLFDYLKWRIAKLLNVRIKTISYDNKNIEETHKIEKLFKTSNIYLKKREGISKLTYLDFLNNEDK